MTYDEALSIVARHFPRGSSMLHQFRAGCLVQSGATDPDAWCEGIKQRVRQHAENRARIRAHVLAMPGVTRCEIRADETVHAYGPMPNNGRIGMHFVGYADDIIRDL